MLANFRTVFILMPLVAWCFLTVVAGSVVFPTKGEVWPMPQAERKHSSYFTFQPSLFNFKIINKNCELLKKAVVRYKATLADLHNLTFRYRRGPAKGGRRRRKEGEKEGRKDRNYHGNLMKLQLNLTKSCEEYPRFKMDESCKACHTLQISTWGALLSGDSIWGMLRGLETAAQLFYITDDFSEVRVNCTEIFDFPQYFHRGLLLDTARHYISVPNILQTLDALAMNKMNVFHWHIVDDESFPYQSKRFPELSAKGAYFPTMVYSRADIEKIIQYATERGIRVIPEFDVPGHTQSWGKSHPLILTECYENGKFSHYGPLHPLRKSTYKLLQDLFREVQALFPDRYFHVGGDEVDVSCWDSSLEIKEFMNKNHIRSVKNINALFMSKVFKMLRPRSIPIVWQEVQQNGIGLPPKTIVQVWKLSGWQQKVAQLANSKTSVLVSAPWYLDHLDRSFLVFYQNDPHSQLPQLVNKSHMSYIVGGEACAWTETVDDRNLHNRIWPRTSAVAEVLWSVTRGDARAALGAVLARITEHACRMTRRGLPTQPPVGPGFCLT